MNSILTMGVDIGSSASKCIILQNGEDIVSKSVVAVGAGTSGPGRAMVSVEVDQQMRSFEQARTALQTFADVISA